MVSRHFEEIHDQQLRRTGAACLASRPEMDNDHPRQRSAKAKRTREGFRTRWHAKHESFVNSNGGRISSSGLVAAIEQEKRPCQREGRKVKARGEDSLGVLGVLCPASVQNKARVRFARNHELRDSFDARRCRLSGRVEGQFFVSRRPKNARDERHETHLPEGSSSRCRCCSSCT